MTNVPSGVPLAPINAAPPGVVGMFTAQGGVYWTIVRYSGQVSADKIAPIMGSYFCTLPPGWAIAVYGGAGATNIELSMTIWYQEVTDNITPAR